MSAWSRCIASCVLCCWTLAGCAISPSLMAVNVPLVDLRAQSHTVAQPAVHDALEETQLLYGEPARVVKVKEGWASIEAIEQPEWTHAGRWQGYPGWLPLSALLPASRAPTPTIVVTETWVNAWRDAGLTLGSPWRFALGTRLRATEAEGRCWRVALLDGTTVWLPRASARSLDELAQLPARGKRQLILRSAALFIGDRYVWGGRSPFWRRSADDEGRSPSPPVTGVDCSGLINLAHRAAGINLPRDAHEQFLRARAVTRLQPADLIFLSARNSPRRIVHVMLYAGDGEIIEGPGTGLAVRRVSLVERLGQPVEQLAPGRIVEGQTVFFGTYLPRTQALSR